MRDLARILSDDQPERQFLTRVHQRDHYDRTDADPNATAGRFTATVNWGDGSSGPAKVRTDKRGVFQVRGGHTYLVAGTYTITVDINDVGGSTVEVTSTATVVSGSGSPDRGSSGLRAATWESATEAHRRRLADALFSSDDWWTSP